MMKHMKPLIAAPATCVVAICLALLHCITAFAVEDASALGLETSTASDGRPLYTEETRPDFPVFNSLVGEENFLSITGPDGETVTDYLELRMGEEYDVAIAYDNNGEPRGISTRAIANDTAVKVDFPATITSERTLAATISARDSQPLSVSSSLTLVATEPMALEIIQGSVRMVNETPTNNSIISEYDLTHGGATIGTNSMIGIVLYGSENAGSVVFKFRTLPIDQTNAGVATSSGQTTDTTTAVAETPSRPNAIDDWSSAEMFWVAIASIALMLLMIYFISTIRDMEKRYRE